VSSDASWQTFREDSWTAPTGVDVGKFNLLRTVVNPIGHQTIYLSSGTVILGSSDEGRTWVRVRAR
jgi:hypothetical protein